MAVLGYNTIGGSNATYGGSGEEYICVKFTSTEAGTITAISTYTYVTFAGSSQSCSWAIFSHDSVNNRPLDLLAQASGTYNTTPAWYSAAISYAFANGETLWLCFWPSTHGTTYYDSGASSQTWRKFAGVTYDTFEDPFTTSNSTDGAEVYSIYVDYTPAAGAAPKLLALTGVG